MAFEEEKHRDISLERVLIGGSDFKPYIRDPKMKFSSSLPSSDAFVLLSLPHIGRADATLPCDAVRAAAACVCVCVSLSVFSILTGALRY